MWSTVREIIICTCVASALGLQVHSEAPVFDPEQDNLIMFSYGKVGSSSLAVALANQMRPRMKNLKYYPRGAIQTRCPQGAKTHFGPVAKSMIEHMNKSQTGRTWIITITRNPFHRDISSYFQNVDHFFPQEQVLSMPISQLQNDFRQRFHEDPNGDDIGNVSYYQTQFKQAVGVSLIDYADRFENGSLHVEHAWHGKPISIILLRFEDISQWEGILGTYFHNFRIPQTSKSGVNRGDQKWYSAVYEQLVKTYSFSEEEIKLLCAGDTMRFYSEKEKLAMVPQCTASSRIPPNLIKDAGRMYAVAGDSKLLLEDLNLN